MKTMVVLTSMALGFGCAFDGELLEETAVEAELALDPAEYHCEEMTEAARVAAPPPPLFTEESLAPRVRAVCPPGQVPFYREVEPERRVGPPMRPGTAPEASAQLAGSYWYAGVMKPTESFNRSGVGAMVLITNPAVYDQYDMVTGQMSIVQGSNYHLVEIGLRKFWDAFPRLMISQWNHGQFQDATGFVRVHGTYGPGMPLSNYYGYAVQHYIRYDNGNWWVWFNDGWVGYFPGSIWSGTFTSGNMAHFYGEVYSAQSRIPPITDMGNGQYSTSAGAAYMQNMCMHGADSTCHWLVNGWRSETNAAHYSLSYWNGSFMRFGGNGGG